MVDRARGLQDTYAPEIAARARTIDVKQLMSELRA
jgi:hypothetical protein